MTKYVTFKANKNTKTASLLQVDWVRFSDDVRAERSKRKLNMREFEAVTGVSFGTISRIENQSPCSTEVFLTLALLMNKDPVLYTRPRGENAEAWLPTPPSTEHNWSGDLLVENLESASSATRWFSAAAQQVLDAAHGVPVSGSADAEPFRGQRPKQA